ncbi:septal ring lytic transglycosylase RlpA family protein [Taylorella equigenitalis]|uniref:Endolytic peptidoglycan transglycosylase RlpA n=3 Tax=Taylorella equigenitalis TaxID=29575 RepID=A0A654KIR9_TAYEM|nr:septal ring lytic transglycosylase RlpA family protein [Taylorella equigenitalis]ADU91786.1 Rare lipoprotein A precursor [Taylorella equigenitalis MCE9]AFN35351.1 putative exported protein [Taylorella equigenitalis ATCC 35865]ASY37316.1 septal ring lytic transglycosylase RlpA family lipoprotein [Taylorella equigenitalis]ASY38782.1 septal ring lytic transglycosylase RlpA family lipoprotein [Taylorella equigenitalis]ASY40306.1 septal ring lytic transglycosylase RlpA family lipoprotein [Taylor
MNFIAHFPKLVIGLCLTVGASVHAETPHFYHDSQAQKGKAYKVAGKVYRPYTKIKEFSQTGTASWYGPGFHGRLTANGQKYNQNALTAAHKELPFNSIVKVTSETTGKSVIVYINDRGPFHNNRIIDLSYEAAKQLGIHKKGTDKVKIELVGFKSDF